MLTSRLWWDFEFKLKCCFNNNNYTYRENDMAWLLLGTILGTPFTIILDILTLPIQIVYQICLKIVKKLRSDIK